MRTGRKVSIQLNDGQVIGNWTILSVISLPGVIRYVMCRCICGNYKKMSVGDLTRTDGRAVKSCGCISHKSNFKHGFYKHRLNSIFTQIKSRCYNEKYKYYKDYGGRGIIVCSEWLNSRPLFFKWAIANGWKQGLQIDRINNNGNYEPSNCRFVTPTENSRNRRSNVLISYKGETKILIEWCEDLGLNYALMSNRARSGMQPPELFETPPKKIPCKRQSKLFFYNGEEKHLTEWCEIVGIKYCTFKYRVSKGWAVKEALETPTNKEASYFKKGMVGKYHPRREQFSAHCHWYRY